MIKLVFRDNEIVKGAMNVVPRSTLRKSGSSIGAHHALFSLHYSPVAGSRSPPGSYFKITKEVNPEGLALIFRVRSIPLHILPSPENPSGHCIHTDSSFPFWL